jgi:solute carrier family 35 (UDP-galactose transporter), member B1
MACSIEALNYVNFPTKELGKSCKMIPVMLFGVLFAGKRYSLRDYLGVGLITAGIVTFNMFGKRKSVSGTLEVLSS